ncbi:MAG TPA: TIGR02449 family protein [Gammaproteobacteria bacterium]|nr:TIGR02449 family protein [Gammaproteobacteria bacterium]
MAANVSRQLDAEIAAIEREVLRLSDIARRLREENRLLAERLNGLNSERAQLLNKNAIVQSRVEAMIARLKGMEQA